ncbi:aspartyl protease family protein [Nannocystis sp. ILAH1]|uniref:aspartyl protease family protein n=1 Tax=unclassified Nannocystis TaxID=2627009 RepID=UPI00226F097A|nr:MULTISPECIES: aspartyl protease family protein [unclassified Nannocystis]MCY0988255.1 aspartyl protease family protein [Nannocystis sp. ILAH1]MCY1067783.1 aspartyl protease family protein [Nannocystis sp. RBIL2]
MSLAPRRLRLSASLTLALAAAVPGCLKVPVGDLDAPGGKEGNPAEAKAVIDRFVAALGGEEALRKIAQRTVEARMTFLPESGCTDKDENCRNTETVGTFTLQSTADQRLYRRTVIDKQIEEEGFDGKTGWQFRRGFLVLEDEDESVITREDAALHWYFDFDKRGINLALEKPRDKDFDGKARVLDGVRWSTKNDLVPPKTQWYDRATGLLAEELLEDDKAEPPISQHIIYDDYRPIDGVLVAHKIRLVNKFGDRTQEVVFVTQRVDHAPIKPEVFQVPKVPAPEKAKDEKLVALAKAREAAAAEPKNLDAQVSLARALWAASHFDEAADAAQVALKLQPKEAEALWILARARVLQGRFKEAGPLLDRAGKAGVRDVLVHAQRAWIASHQRDFPGVADALDHLGEANAQLAGRYRNFAGKPLQVSFKGNGCTAELPIATEGTVTFVDVQIGEEKVRALVDTGASDVILDGEVAAKLKLPVRSKSRLGGEGGPEIGHGQIEALTAGNATISGIPVDVFPHQVLEQMTGGVGAAPQAVLGARVLELFQVNFDLPNNKLVLVNPVAKCKSALAANRTGSGAPFYLHETHFLYVLAAMNGAEGLFLVNTGMQGVAVTATTKAFARAGIGAPPLRRNEAALVDVAEFTVGDAFKALGLRGAYGYFEQNESSDQFRIDGMLGLDFVGRGRLTIDYPERKLYFAAPPAEAATAPAAAAPAKGK